MTDLITFLQYWGITPQQITPLILVGAIMIGLLWRYFLRDIKQEVTDLHHATREIQMYIEDEDDGGWTPQHGLGTNPVFSVYGTHNSPSVPNKKGEKLLEDSKFNEQYPKFKDDLFVLMDKMELRTPYDFERGAKTALRRLQNDPSFDPIKNYAVSHPNEPLSIIFMVASWIIRDDYAKYREKYKKS